MQPGSQHWAWIRSGTTQRGLRIAVVTCVTVVARAEWVSSPGELPQSQRIVLNWRPDHCAGVISAPGPLHCGEWNSVPTCLGVAPTPAACDQMVPTRRHDTPHAETRTHRAEAAAILGVRLTPSTRWPLLAMDPPHHQPARTRGSIDVLDLFWCQDDCTCVISVAADVEPQTRREY